MDESEVKRIEQDQEVRRVLLAAAELLEKDGWCQGKHMDGQRRCVGWAIADSTEGRMRNVLHVLDAYLEQDAVTWNDTPGRTLPEVLAALRGAAG